MPSLRLPALILSSVLLGLAGCSMRSGQSTMVRAELGRPYAEMRAHSNAKMESMTTVIDGRLSGGVFIQEPFTFVYGNPKVLRLTLTDIGGSSVPASVISTSADYVHAITITPHNTLLNVADALEKGKELLGDLKAQGFNELGVERQFVPTKYKFLGGQRKHNPKSFNELALAFSDPEFFLQTAQVFKIAKDGVEITLWMENERRATTDYARSEVEQGLSSATLAKEKIYHLKLSLANENFVNYHAMPKPLAK